MNKKLKLNIMLWTISGMMVTSNFVAVRPASAKTGYVNDLFISEYVEGKANNKAIEIYNGTDHEVDLSEYSITINGFNSKFNQFKNENIAIKADKSNKGDKTYKAVEVKTLKSGETLTIVNPNSDNNLKSKGTFINKNITGFNGDDTIILNHKDKVIDSIGQVGNKNQWGVDKILVRKANITQGDTDTSDSFDPSSEWDEYECNEFYHLGSHTMTGFGESGEDVALTGLTIDGVSEVQEGSNTKLNVKYEPENTTQKQLNWTSSDTSIAVVTSDGTVNGLKEGNVTITATSVNNKDIKHFGTKNISEVRTLKDGSLTLVEGVVTANIGIATYIQDDTGGIALLLPKGSNLKFNIGDKVQVKGEIKDYNGLAEIFPNSQDDVTVLQKEASVPEAKVIDSSQLGEDVEGQLVKIENVELTEVDQYYNYTAKDSEGNIKIKSNSKEGLEEGYNYTSITGVVGYDHNEYKIIARSLEDIVEDNNIVKPVNASVSSGEIDKGSFVKLSTGTEGAEIYYTTDGTEPTKDSTKYTDPIKVDENITIKAIAIKEGTKDSNVRSFNYTALDPKPVIEIHDIQGAAQRSPRENENVNNVVGVVTDIQKDDYSKGFYIQSTNPDDNEGTSEGIYIDQKSGDKNANNISVKIGDLIAVDGTVKEVPNTMKGNEDAELTITQINPSTLRIKSNGNKVPDAIVIGENGKKCPSKVDINGFENFNPEEDAIDFYESLEGMLVEVQEPLVVGADERYGEIAVVPDNGRGLEEAMSDRGGIIATKDNPNPQKIIIDDVIIPITSKSKKYIDSNFTVKVRDKFSKSIKGVMSYGFGNFKVLNTEKLPELKDGELKREVTHINFEEDKLNVATYNIENFSPEEGERIGKVAESIVDNLKCPDIISLIEVQDNNGAKSGKDTKLDGVVDASESLQCLIDAIKEKSKVKYGEKGVIEYGFTQINPVDGEDGGAPTANIRPVFIYRKDRVKLAEGTEGDNKTDVSLNGSGKDLHLTVNPGRLGNEGGTFKSSRKPLVAEFMFKGEKVFAIANHFCSKRGDDGIYGPTQPPELKSEEPRIKQAKVVNTFMKEILKSDPDANILCMGDLNDYEYSAPVQAVKGDIMTNMIEELPLEERHTYIYQGNSQVLDNLLVSNNLKEKTIVDVVNINSEFTQKDGRVSDHDPVLVQVDLLKDSKPNSEVKIDNTEIQKQLDIIKNNKSGVVSIKVTNDQSESKDVTLIVAQYNEKGKMIDIQKQHKQISAKKNNEDLECNIKLVEGATKIKCFVWDTIYGMKPLTNSVSSRL